MGWRICSCVQLFRACVSIAYVSFVDASGIVYLRKVCASVIKNSGRRLGNLPGWRWARIKQLALVGLSSSRHSEACNALGGSFGGRPQQNFCQRRFAQAQLPINKKITAWFQLRLASKQVCVWLLRVCVVGEVMFFSA